MKSLRTLAVLSVAALAAPAYAITITPTYTNFGALPAATFGGSGIPNTSVAITTVGNVTLGLSAAQRFGNPTVTDNGAGTFFAVAGDDSANGQPSYARWNFNFYVAGLTQGQSVNLYYDKAPGAGTNVTTFLGPVFVDSQNSWNLGMGFLTGAFNPNAAGEYGFALVLNNVQGQELGRSAILVNVGNVPDTGVTAALFAAALLGLAAVRRRFLAA